MGKIRTKLIKRTARDFASTSAAQFSLDFQKNKQVLAEKRTASTKKLRNQIAGYLTRKMRQNARAAAQE